MGLHLGSDHVPFSNVDLLVLIACDRVLAPVDEAHTLKGYPARIVVVLDSHPPNGSQSLGVRIGYRLWASAILVMEAKG